MRFIVYQLADPRTEQPRYVGYTTDLARRQQEYQRGPAHSRGLALWFAELKALTLQPLVTELEVVEGTIEEVLQREVAWIHRLSERGEALFNVQGSLTRQQREKKTILLLPEQARWLEIQAATEPREMSDIVGEALALYERLYVEKSK